MLKTSLPIYLASKSPRRKKLLEQIRLNFRVLKINSRERIKEGETPIQNVKRISSEKLELAKKKITKGIIITADTTVVIDNEIIGKPKSKKEARLILNKLSGRTHFVYTGFSIYNSEKNISLTDYEKTSVTFRRLTQEEIRDYINSGSPMDKAGAYGIQDDFGAVFVKKINGCYYNVVGLPLSKLYKRLVEIS